MRVVSRPFEIWREKDRLPEVLSEIYSQLFSAEKPEALAVTMTAELSDVFATKRDGVTFVLESIRSVFPRSGDLCFESVGRFMPVCEALRIHWIMLRPIGWLPRSGLRENFPNCLLMDVGSTTTDILPVLDGQRERRRAHGHGAPGLRENLCSRAFCAPISQRSCKRCRLQGAAAGLLRSILPSAGTCISSWGNLRPQDYTCATPDGQPPSLDSARRRLARLVCADTEMLSAGEIDAMARYIYARQVYQIREGLSQVLSRLPDLRQNPVVVVGLRSVSRVGCCKKHGSDR